MTPVAKFLDFKVIRSENKIQAIPVNKIRLSPYHPRRDIDNEALYALSQSIRAYGVLQPIAIRLINGKGYELISGERRLDAAKLAGMETIPAIILNIPERESGVLSLIENIQVQHLHFFEIAEAYQSILDYYAISPEELSKKINKSQTEIMGRLKFLRLIPQVRKLIMDNDMSERHARALLKIPDPATQLDVALQVIDKDLNPRATEDLVEENLELLRFQKSIATIASIKQKETVKVSDMRLFTNSIRQSVDIIKKSGLDASYEAQDNGNIYEISIQIKR